MSAPDVWLSVLLSVVFAGGAVAVAMRLSRARRVGLSIRLQVFLVLTGLSFALSLSFLALVVTPGELSGVSPSRASIRMGFSVLGLAVVAALCAVVIGWVVARPLERLTRAAQRIAAGERQAVLPIPRGREARELTRAFEAMRSELEQRHAVERFAADLSHELKNPIAAIRASSEVLADAMTDDIATARRLLERIVQAGDKLERLTADLLTLARIEARGASEAHRWVELSAVVAAAREGVHALAESRGVSLALSTGKVTVRADAGELQRALENLLRNACEASPPGGSVELCVALDADEVHIVVRDHGIGVDPALGDKLFERFVTTRRAEGGSGLGLSIVRAVAEMHGGRAEQRPVEGPGASFVLVLPLR